MIRDAKGVVRLLDFGIAKQLDAATTDGLTSTGVRVPKSIIPILRKALAKDASLRQQSARELLEQSKRRALGRRPAGPPRR